jgi:hypothetical protein
MGEIVSKLLAAALTFATLEFSHKYTATDPRLGQPGTRSLIIPITQIVRLLISVLLRPFYDQPKNNNGIEERTFDSVHRRADSEWVWMPEAPGLITDEQPYEWEVTHDKSYQCQCEGSSENYCRASRHAVF